MALLRIGSCILFATVLSCDAAPVAASAPVPGLALLRSGEAHRIARSQGADDLAELPSYCLDLSVSDVEGRYEGRGTLGWTNTTNRAQPTLPLLLHPNAADGATADRGTLEIRTLSCSDGPTCSWQLTSDTVVEVTLDPPLAPGERVEIETTFGGQLRLLSASANDVFTQAMGGLESMTSPVGVADYGLLGQGDGLLTAASAYPALAPFLDDAPVVDRPSRVGDLAWNQVAVFDVRVVTPRGLQVVTNLGDEAPEFPSDETQVVRARGAGVRDFVLLASRDWEMRSRQVGGVQLRSWFLSRDREAGVAALDTAEVSLKLYEELLGAYPYTELDVVEATLVGGAGGVEFSSLVLVAGFLYRDPASSQSPLAGLMQMLSSLGAGGAPVVEMGSMLEGQRRFVVAHELAHQWCPGLVGTSSQSSPVIDEALAQYLAGRVSEAVLGGERGREERDRSVLLNYALFRLLGGVDGVADRPTHAYGSSLEYGALVYGKAPYLYVDAETTAGRATVEKALRHAMDELAWRVVDVDTWLAALEEGGLAGARGRGDRWWRGTHGDEDLGIDAEGRTAMRLMFGEEMAAELEQSLAILGMNLGDLMGMMMGGMPTSTPYAPGTPSPEEMLKLLEGL